MESFDIAFIITTIIVAVGIIGMIVNWFLIGSLSSKIRLLEDEVDKKTTELYKIKKRIGKQKAVNKKDAEDEEKGSSVPESKAKPETENAAETVAGTEEEQQQSSPVHIDDTAADGELRDTTSHKNADNEKRHEQDLGASTDESDTSGIELFSSMPQKPPPSQQQTTAAHSTQEEKGTPPGSENAADQGKESYTSISETADDAQETVYLQLYSPTRKDTDFAGAWRTLAEKLKKVDAPHVILDLSDVLFLYEKEMKYLSRMHETVKKCNGTLSLVNCESDLRTMIMKDPVLSGDLA